MEVNGASGGDCCVDEGDALLGDAGCSTSFVEVPACWVITDDLVPAAGADSCRPQFLLGEMNLGVVGGTGPGEADVRPPMDSSLLTTERNSFANSSFASKAVETEEDEGEHVSSVLTVIVLNELPLPGLGDVGDFCSKVDPKCRSLGVFFKLLGVLQTKFVVLVGEQGVRDSRTKQGCGCGPASSNRGLGVTTSKRRKISVTSQIARSS